MIPDMIEGVIIKNQDLPSEYTSTPRTYGGILLDANEQALLSLPPKYAIFETVDSERCESEIEKSLAKLRWEESSTDNANQKQQGKWHDQRTKTMDFR